MAIVKSFYDGRGIAKSKLVVLSGLVANSIDTWFGFQEEWKARVMPCTGNAPLSVTDCLSGRNDFESIPEPMRMRALVEAVTVVNTWTRQGIDAYSCVVLMDDYRKCALDSPVPKLVPPEAICVDDIIPRIDYQFPDEQTRFELYFDREERFLGHVEPYWKGRPGRRIDGPYYLRRVAILVPASDEYAAIQAADLYTWTVHTHCMRRWVGRNSAYIPAQLSGIIQEPPINRLWDYDTLKSDNNSRNRVLASPTRVPSWKLPVIR